MFNPLRKSLIVLALGIPLGCTPASKTPLPQDGFDRTQMLINLSDNIIVPTLAAFKEDAQALDNAAKAYEANPSESERTNLQQAWTQAMVTWQRAEVYQVGPAGVAGVSTYGQGLRDEIYSWPRQNPCAIDQQIVDQGYIDNDFFNAALVDAYGLDALEYLAFGERDDNACSATATINRSGSWRALDESVRVERSALYASRVASHVLEKSNRIYDQWQNTFSENFKKGKGEFQNAQSVVDEVFAALYYLELRVKDKKLALPLGLNIDCRAETCPESVESYFSRTSLSNIAENLRAGRALMTGSLEADAEGFGFEDFLIELGAPEVAKEMVDTLDRAIFLCEAEDRPLGQLIEEDPAAAQAIYDAVKSFTDIMKSDFVTVLNLRVPQEGAGDND